MVVPNEDAKTHVHLLRLAPLGAVEDAPQDELLVETDEADGERERSYIRARLPQCSDDGGMP